MATNFTDVITNRQVELSFTPPQNYFLTCERLSKVVFTVQSFTIPTINGGESVLPNSLNPTRMYVPGDGIDYGSLDATVVIDKNFTAYREFLLWMKAINVPESSDQFTEYSKRIRGSGPEFSKTMTNIELFGTDAGNRPIVAWKFKNAFPISLEGPQYNSSSIDVEPLTCTMTFRYMYFEHETYTDGKANNDSI